MNPRAITADEAIALLPDEDDIHTLLDGDGCLLGMCFSRGHVERRIRDAALIFVSAGMARAGLHGVCIYEEMPEHLLQELEKEHGPSPRPFTRPMFVETDEAKLDAFDPPAVVS